MEELLTIFNEKRCKIGVASREDVHIKGYWHETFQCWFIDKENGLDYIYLQKRCEDKKDFPNLFDITAAGHLLSTETAKDGIREIKEELGIDVKFHELRSIGVMNDIIETPDIIDKEWANVYVYNVKDTDKFLLQQEEVAGIVKVKLEDFVDLCFSKKQSIHVLGFGNTHSDQPTIIDQHISLADIVPHSAEYLQKVCAKIIEDSSQ
ncbi:NUDIX domain-containing protein [Gracilibacillus sp. S3-1-1]|uniref:NUDIX domain-containing protein n=1 Tax=Gracilibacillus pellucidus TaxID=3095368 RepID=A0ACC6M675_9BACI|nr:NUDIX domain-containing protein [Gracilibacillus sp. S3-1-1]MDX8046459.1 NUDIX domain-containing protein [Gracilibacillus sp. S3-1-1]